MSIEPAGGSKTGAHRPCRLQAGSSGSTDAWFDVAGSARLRSGLPAKLPVTPKRAASGGAASRRKPPKPPLRALEPRPDQPLVVAGMRVLCRFVGHVFVALADHVDARRDDRDFDGRRSDRLAAASACASYPLNARLAGEPPTGRASSRTLRSRRCRRRCDRGVSRFMVCLLCRWSWCSVVGCGLRGSGFRSSGPACLRCSLSGRTNRRRARTLNDVATERTKRGASAPDARRGAS